MDAQAARRALGRGRLVGAITLPAGFEAAVRRGETVPLEVQVDNLNEDLLFDLQRALPSAVLGFGHAVGLPGLRATIRERDLLPHDIPFLKYLAVSALALVAFVIAAALAALAVAREWEHKTLKLLRLSPASLGAVLAGKLAASGAVAAVAVARRRRDRDGRLRRGARLAARRHRPRSSCASCSSRALGAWIGALLPPHARRSCRSSSAWRCRCSSTAARSSPRASTASASGPSRTCRRCTTRSACSSGPSSACA